MSIDTLKHSLSSHTKLIILNSPSNPTGMAYSAETLGAIAELLKEYPDVWLLTDDIYEYIHWNDAPLAHILKIAPELQERTIIINGVSKAYAMTGWRIGYAAGPQVIMQAMKKIQSQSTSCPNSIAQKAAAAAINLPHATLAPMIEAFSQRHQMVYAAIQAMPDLDMLPADGAFYAWVNIERLLAKSTVHDDVSMAQKLLEEAGIAVVPGSAFGAPGHFRLSFALDETSLTQALEQIDQFCRSLG